MERPIIVNSLVKIFFSKQAIGLWEPTGYNVCTQSGHFHFGRLNAFLCVNAEFPKIVSTISFEHFCFKSFIELFPGNRHNVFF